MTDRSCSVVKLGGSLLAAPNWPQRLRAWMERQPSGRFYFVVGGGGVIEALRQWDRQHPLLASEMHWRCIRVLDATFEMAVELMPEIEAIASQEDLRLSLHPASEANRHRVFWVRVGAFYSQECLDQIPIALRPECTWDTTSDSLALLLASLIGANRCVLIKSCSVDHLVTLNQAIQEGVVDSECARFQNTVPTIEFVQI